MNNFALGIRPVPLNIPYHDEILSGDTLTNLSINREWRGILQQAIALGMNVQRKFYTDEEYTLIQARLSAIYIDLYD